jgi:hypothetical protein
MAIVVLDSVIAPGKAVRNLMYEDDAELSGASLATVNAGTVECEIGSIATKLGFAAKVQLGSDGDWHDNTTPGE